MFTFFSLNKKKKKYKVADLNNFKIRLLDYLRHHKCFCFLDSNDSSSKNSFNFLAAFKPKKQLIKLDHPFEDLQNMINSYQDWLFGYLGYDLKNIIEDLTSNNSDRLAFPHIHFFIPSILVKVKNQSIEIIYDSSYSSIEIDDLFERICSANYVQDFKQKIKVKPRVSKEDYIKNINLIKKHLQEGDIYEMNYCQEFYADNVDLDPFALFEYLNRVSKAPFSCFYRVNDNFCLCASPERYLKKEGDSIMSQPIKGTIKRLKDFKLDLDNKHKLMTSAKDISENIMIVDLVRNDLSRIAAKGTVSVTELACLYSYENVHHLISTIKCDLDKKYNIVDIIKATFPMGSMTGAPKIRAMELIDKFENTLRGIYSGAIGYISPEEDFDFNVVIRSLFYNKKNKYLSFMVGGAITIESDPESEYQECLVKAKSILKVLGQ